MKNTKSIVDILLRNMYSPYAYDNDAIHHLIMALAPTAADGKNYASDGLGFIFHQYRGRIPEETTKQTAEILNLEPDDDLIAVEFLKRSESAIALMNLKHLNVNAEDGYIAAVNEIHAEMPELKRGLAKSVSHLFSEVETEKHYKTMSAKRAFAELENKLRNITPGLPSSLPNGLVERLAPTANAKYAFSVPYLLFVPSDLLSFANDTVTGLSEIDNMLVAKLAGAAPIEYL